MKLRHHEDYRELRAREYPSVGEQLDALWKAVALGDRQAMQDMLAKITAVKQRYPKS